MGLTMQEIAEAVQRMQSRGEAVDDVADAVKPGDYSDAGNAEVFIARNRGRMVYTDSRGWLIWDGKRWATDDHKAYQMAVQLSGEMLADAQAEYQAALFNQAAVKGAEAANGRKQSGSSGKGRSGSRPGKGLPFSRPAISERETDQGRAGDCKARIGNRPGCAGRESNGIEHAERDLWTSPPARSGRTTQKRTVLI